jgi:hypothetical protein
MHRKGSVIAGAVWMLVISLLLFWLPLLGPLLAGFVGGKRAGGVGRAIAAVFLPAVIIGFVVFLLFTIPGFPLVGALTGGVAFLTVAVALVGPLLIGAIVGGALA